MSPPPAGQGWQKHVSGNGKAEAELAGPVYHTNLGEKSLQEKGRREGRAGGEDETLEDAALG